LPRAADLIHGPDKEPRPATIEPPPGACDTHAHLYGPFDRFPIDPAKGDGPDVSAQDYIAMLDTIGIDRAVLVQARDYGGIDPVTLDAIRRSNGRFRGITMLSPEALDRNIQTLVTNGFVGIRLSSFSHVQFRTDLLEEYAPRLAELGWVALIHLDSIDEMFDLAPRIRALPIDVIVDHMGRPRSDQGTNSPGFQALLSLLRDGDNCWSKICSWYRLSETGSPYDDMRPFAEALIDIRPDRLVWGSNWPHPNSPVTIPNDGDLFNQFMEWAGDDSTRRQILTDNPAQLFGFE
jgi:predicted TIM-barrel fold metal-dependent hydrolase